MKIEKTLMILMGIMFVSLFMIVLIISVSIYDAGGISEVIIEAGKEVKYIAQEIAKD